ncbi:MAG: hypothetical protein AAGB51_08260 [Planctomycetota bacterium]
MATATAPKSTSVRNVVIVTLLTVLIWIVSEGQSVRSRVFEIRVTLDPAIENLDVSVTQPGWTGLVELSVTGSIAALDAFGDEAAQGLTLRAGSDFSADPGAATVELAEALRGTQALRSAGVTLTRADPPAISVIVERLTRVTLPVAVTTPEGLLAEPPAATPESVILVLTETDARRIADTAQVEAVVTGDRLQGLEPGRTQRIPNVPVNRPVALRGVEGVSIVPSVVEVSLRLRDRTRSVVVPRVPVSIRSSSAVYNDFDIELLDPFIADVTVSGPGEDLDALPSDAEGNPLVIATVSLSADELERAASDGAELLKPVLFSDLPTTIRFEVAGSPAGGPVVRLRVERRPEPTEEASGDPIGAAGPSE